MGIRSLPTELKDRKELKKGSAELLILSLIEDRPRHGYEIASLIEAKTGGALQYYAASLYPTLYRLEADGFIQGRWVEKAGVRRRRYYRLTRSGAARLAKERSTWREFFDALNLVAAFR